MKMRGLLAVGICIIIGAAIISLSYRYEVTQTTEEHVKNDRPADELSRWIDERGKSKLLEDVEAEKSRAKTFLLALDHYRYVLKPGSSIEEAIQYANSHWDEYVNRRDRNEIADKIQAEKAKRNAKQDIKGKI
jgi:hypothetical protein